MTKILIPFVCFAFLGACALPVTVNTAPTTAEAAVAATVQTDVSSVATMVESACKDVNVAASLAAPFSIVPQIGAVLTFANASCGGADAIAALTVKAVNDPSTVAWAEGLATTINTAVANLKAVKL